MTANKFLRLIGSLLITALFVYFLVHWIDWSRFLVLVRQVRLEYVLVGSISYACVYAVRAVRMQALIPHTEFVPLFWINSVQYFLNKMLPMRTGEFTLPMLLQRYTKASFGRGLATLLLLRYMDLMIIMTLLSLSLYFVAVPQIVPYRDYVWLLFLAVFGMFVVLLFLPRLAKKIPRLKQFIPSTGYGQFIAAGLRDTLLAWLFFYGYLYCLVHALHLSFSFWAVVFAATFSILTIVLPVSAIGNFGTFEAGWVIGFVMLGMTKGDALATGFFTNVVLTLLNALLAGFGTVYLETKRLQVR